MAFGFYRPLTIDHTKCGASDSIDFPVGFIGTFSWCATVANGGRMQSASAFDLRPYADTGAVTARVFELVAPSYNATTGAVEMYWKEPTLSHSVDTLDYMFIGDASLTTDGSSNATWNSAFKFVAHFGGGVTLSLSDSTSNANTLTNNAGVTAVAGGQGGGAAAFLGSSSQYLSSATPPVTALPMTITALFYETNFTANQNGVTMNPTSANVIGIQLDTRTTANARASQNAGQATSAATFATTTWVHAGGRYVSLTDRSVYLNGTGTQNTTSTTLNVPNQLAIGAFKTNGAAAGFWTGRIDEVRISNVDRGADWMTAESNNLLAPATFITVGSEVGSGVTASPSAAVSSWNSVAPVITIGGGPTVTPGPSISTWIVNAGVAANGPLGANQALIAAADGDAAWPGVYDPRLNLTVAAGKGSDLADAVGVTGGRTPGPTLTQATAGKRPTLNGVQGSGSEFLDFVSASSTILAAPQDARFKLDGAGPLHCFVIAKVTVAGPLAGAAADPTNAGTYPFIAVRPAAGNWKGEFGATSGANDTAPDSGTAFNDGVVRVASIGKQPDNAIVGAQGGNATYQFTLAGRQPQLLRSVVVATTVAGGLKPFVGGLGANYVSASFYWMGFYSGPNLKKAQAAVVAFAQSQFGAVLDLSKWGSYVEQGDSLTLGLTSSDPNSGLAGHGTTSMGYVASRTNTGLGTLLAQGVDVGQDASFNVAISGRHIQHVIDTLDDEVGVYFDGYRGGGAFVRLWIGTNDLFGGDSAATCLARMATLATNIRAYGAKVVVCTIIDRTSWYTGGVLNAVGTEVQAFNAGLRANAGNAYHDGFLIDLEADASNAYKINLAGTKASTVAAVYSDGTHLTDAGYASAGAIQKAFYDANSHALFGTNVATPAPSIVTWVVVPATFGGSPIIATPSAAVAVWVAPAPATSVGPVTAAPSAAVSAWSSIAPSISVGGITALPTVSVSTWSAPAALGTPGPVTVSAVSAVSTWNAVSPIITLGGGGVATPGPAIATWVVPPVRFGPAIIPQHAFTASIVIRPALAAKLSILPGGSS